MMDRLLTLLQQSCHEAVTRSQVAMQNVVAAQADADDMPQAVDKREGHREWSCFTPPEGRA